VEPKVSIAYISPSSILAVSPSASQRIREVERGNGKRGRTVVHGNTLTPVDLVGIDRVSAERSDSLHWIGLAFDSNLVGLHHLLDRLPDLRHLDINAGTTDPRVGRIFDSSKKVVELRIKGNSPCTVNDMTYSIGRATEECQKRQRQTRRSSGPRPSI
jgi:hypothetical protein